MDKTPGAEGAGAEKCGINGINPGGAVFHRGGRKPPRHGLRPASARAHNHGGPWVGRSRADTYRDEVIFPRGRRGRTPSPACGWPISPFQGALGSENLTRSDLSKCVDGQLTHVREDKPRCGPAQEAPPERGRWAAAEGRGEGVRPRRPRWNITPSRYVSARDLPTHGPPWLWARAIPAPPAAPPGRGCTGGVPDAALSADSQPPRSAYRFF